MSSADNEEVASHSDVFLYVQNNSDFDVLIEVYKVVIDGRKAQVLHKYRVLAGEKFYGQISRLSGGYEKNTIFDVSFDIYEMFAYKHRGPYLTTPSARFVIE